MTPMTALFWRQWRETRVALIGGAAFTLVLAASMGMMQATGTGIEPRELNLFAGFVAGFVAIGAGLSILFSHADGARLTSALTAQWLTLPVRGWKLAAALTFYRFTAFGAVVGLSLLILLGALTTDVYYDAPDLGTFGGILSPAGAAVFWFAAMGLFAVAQGVEWTLRLVSPFLAWAVYAVVFGSFLWSAEADLAWEAGLLQAYASAFHVGAALSFVGVIAQRRGLLNVLEAPGIVQPARAGKRPFRSPDAALRWLEWRIAGRWALGYSILATAAMFVIGPLMGWAELAFFSASFNDVELSQLLGASRTWSFMVFISSLYLALLAVISVGFYMTFVRRRTMQDGANLCYATAPVTTARLAKASFLSAVQLAACVLLGAAIASGVSALLSAAVATEMYPLDGRMYLAIMPGAALLLPLAIFAGYLSAAFTLPIYCLTLLIVLGASLAAGSDLTLDDGAFPVFSVMAAFGIGACAVYAFRHGHYGARGVIGMCAWAAIIASALYLGFTVGDVWSETGANASAAYIAACAAAIAPLAFWPAYLAWLRTR